MKKLACFLLITVLISCKKETLPPIEPKQQITAAKGTLTLQDTRVYDWTGTQIINICTGKLMTATKWNVTIRATGSVTKLKTTVNFHVTSQFSFIDASGNTYHGTGLTITTDSHVPGDSMTIFDVYTHEHINGIVNLTFTQRYNVKIYDDGHIEYDSKPVDKFYCK